jgi:hypothetical protein
MYQVVSNPVFTSGGLRFVSLTRTDSSASGFLSYFRHPSQLKLMTIFWIVTPSNGETKIPFKIIRVLKYKNIKASRGRVVKLHPFRARIKVDPSVSLSVCLSAGQMYQSDHGYTDFM